MNVLKEQKIISNLQDVDEDVFPTKSIRQCAVNYRNGTDISNVDEGSSFLLVVMLLLSSMLWFS